MLSPLRNRFGIPGVISVIALVFAMFGGAYAATNSEGGKATSSAKAKKGPRGPRGPAGPVGAQGPAGPAGAKGDAGAPGANGSNGKDGTSVSNTSEPKGANCKEGGTKLVGTSTTYACNGEKGAAGAPGSPWTAGGVLPPGKTETGAWAFGELTAGSAPGVFALYRLPISFSLPLPGGASGGLPATNVHYVNIEGKEMRGRSTPTPDPSPSTVCTGSASNPTAAAGHLCVYEGFLTAGTLVNETITKLDGSEAEGASTAGAWLGVFSPTAGATGWGSWAVTAEQ